MSGVRLLSIPVFYETAFITITAFNELLLLIRHIDAPRSHAWLRARGNQQMSWKFSFVAGAAFALTGCAKSPESIAPAYVSDMSYRSWSCIQLDEEATRVSAALTQASEQQSQARTNDTVGVILIGIPTASLSGDNIAPQVASLKGQQEALRRTQIGKNCR